MGVGYVMHCTLCKINYSARKHWYRHLLGSDHQNGARFELGQWDEQVRKCAVILYTSFPLVNSAADEVLQYFSTVKGTIIVTDFVLPSTSGLKTAILQFESKMIVNQILLEIGGPSTKIDGRMVQLRKLGNMLELEWNQLVESFQASEDFRVRSPPEQAAQSSTVTNTNVIKFTPPTSSLVENRQWCKDRVEERVAESKGNGGMDNIGDNVKMVCNQFQSVLQEVEIPDDEFNLVMEAVQIIKNLSKEKIPECNVALYRNNFLKLRNNVRSKRYLLLVYDQVKNGDVNDMVKKLTISHFKGYFFKKSDSILQHLNAVQEHWEESNDSRCWSEPQRLFSHQQLGIEFKLTCVPKSIIEMQLSRLVTYLCEFDTRVKPLLTMAYYWTNVNNISFGQHKAHILHNVCATMNVPNPAALEWLLLFFLYHNERIIPVPREILDRPHLSIPIKNLDYGFKFDLDFVEHWCLQTNKIGVPCEGTIEFVLSVLELFQKFFVFSGALCEAETSVLNTRDGEIVTLSTSTRDVKNKRFLEVLKSSSAHCAPGLIITHPFTFTTKARLSLDKAEWFWTVCPAMKKTSLQLLQFIGSLKDFIASSNHTQQTFQRSLKDALRVT